MSKKKPNKKKLNLNHNYVLKKLYKLLKQILYFGKDKKIFTELEPLPLYDQLELKNTI
jgi:hypothetical protein